MTALRYLTILLTVPWLTACPAGEQSQTLQGQVEWDEIDLSSRVSARVRELHVQLGDRVEPEQILVRLDDDLIAIRSERAQVGIEQAHLQKQLVDQATRQEELAQLKAAVRLAESQWEFASSSLTRALQLFEQGAIAAQQRDEIQAKERAAKAQLDMARAKWEAGQKGAREEQKALAAAAVTQAQTGLAEIDAYDKDLSLRAVRAGVVQAIHARPGELVPQGYPVLTLVDADHPRFSFYVTEQRLAAYATGRTYTVRIPALGGKKVPARLQRIQVLPPVLTLVVTEERAARDLRSFELTLVPTESISGLQAGMSVQLEEQGHGQAH